MAVGPRAVVEAPQATPGRRGLLSAAVEVTEGDERWVNGFAYEAESCDAAQALAIWCAPGQQDGSYEKVPGESGGIVNYDPFLVIGADSCTTLDRGRDRLGRARRQLLATESEQIERELWDGAIAQAEGYDNPYFAAAGVATDLGTAGYVAAFAALEQYLAECLHGRRGMIHATPYTVSLWMAAGLLRVEGGLLLSALDTIVVAGAGYSGSAPGDPPTPPADLTAAANAYATGLVYVRRGAITPADDGDEASRIDRAINTETVFVERPVAAVFDCCLGTVTVDHTDSGTSDALLLSG